MKLLVPLALFLAGAFAGPAQKRQLVSRCDMFCTEQYAPVCGSDGKTYSNMCFLTVAACHYAEKGMSLTLSSQGACGGGIGSVGNVTGQVDQSACDLICDEERKPLCASDGVVYDNACLFKRAECEAAKNNTRLTVVMNGASCPTPKAPECSKYHLDTSDIAVEGGAHISPSCPHTYDRSAYVCASDGQTYSNECQLCHSMELKQVDLTIIYSGVCHHSSSLLGSGSGSLSDLLHQGGIDPLAG